MSSKKKTEKYKADIETVSDRKIYINIKKLEQGNYELIIMHDNKLISKTDFYKK
ncbi:MAG TPA: hypothetical protein PKI08_08085 [Aquaticitalea sp.]|nr:hypothetical protein [Aquaticitalea sp.]